MPLFQTLKEKSLSWKTLEWLLTQKLLVCSSSVTAVHTRIEEPWEGILLVSRGYASFNWFSRDGTRTGSLIFETDPNSDDVEWVIEVCKSFEPGHEAFARKN